MICMIVGESDLMREFKTMCKDSKTGMRMVLSECSYNMACSWLESKGFTEYAKFESCGDEVWLTFEKPVEMLFVYDEARGYLLSN